MLVILGSTSFGLSYGSVQSEAQEDLNAGCRDEQTQVYRLTYKDFVCVEPATADRWVELGIAEIVQPSKIETEEKIPDENFSVSDYEAQYPGAPPPPPEKSAPNPDSVCREGQVLIFHYSYNDTICTTMGTAITWERWGLAQIITDEESMDIQIPMKEEPEIQEAEIPVVNSTKTIQTSLNSLEEEYQNDNVSEIESHSLFKINNMTVSPQILYIKENLWIGIGYDSTNSLLIEADDGIIVIDTLTSYDSAKTLLKDFREISDKPIQIIAYTHSNSDLVKGAQAFLEEGNGSVEIITHVDKSDNFIVENYLNAQPNHNYSSKFTINVPGLILILEHNNGLLSDQTFLFLPDLDSFLVSDNLVGIFPIAMDTDFITNYYTELSENENPND